MTHLRFDMRMADRHPQTIMEDLSVKYQIATPQTAADQWWFWNCENIPDPLPVFLSILDANPSDMVGFGLSQQEAESIASFT